MPELPETETISRDLDSRIKGSTIKTIEVFRADVLRECDTTLISQRLHNARFTRIWRRAKMIILDLDSKDGSPIHIVVQPKFTGALLVDDGSLSEDLLNYLTLTMKLDDGRSLHYRDVRRLGTVALMEHDRFLGYTGALGPEPLDPSFNAEMLKACMGKSRRPIKALLMDQSKLAGVGNIYAAEVLWAAEIAPTRNIATLTSAEWDSLFRELQRILKASIEVRGTSFRDYRDSRGERGGYVSYLTVYGRGGQNCFRCATQLTSTHDIDGRSTVYCSNCQK